MVDAAGADVLAVLTRAPSSGGKSRLFAELGRRSDPQLLEALLLDTIAAAPPGVRVVVVVTPGSACEDVRTLVGAIEVIPQVQGDLGERMRAAMADLFEQGARTVALIGSDLPHITPAVITEAFEALERDPESLVLGPAADGGYYLIAARRVPDVFTGIEWGTDRVLDHTRRAALAQGLKVHLLNEMTDVDTAGDLREICAGNAAPPRTAEWLRRFGIY